MKKNRVTVEEIKKISRKIFRRYEFQDKKYKIILLIQGNKVPKYNPTGYGKQNNLWL